VRPDENLEDSYCNICLSSESWSDDTLVLYLKLIWLY